MDFNNIIPNLQAFATFYGIKIIAAIVIFVVGRWVARALRNATKRMMAKGNVDETLISFVGNLTYIALLAFVIIAAINQLGIQTTSFIAVIGAAGVLMIIFRPFKAGDYIEGAGVAGTVEEVQIFATQLKTPDNKTIIVPNAKMMGDNITNYSAKDTRRVDMVIGVGYGDDLKKVREILEDILAKDDRFLEDPAPTIGVLELGDNSVNFAVRPWVKTEDYWGAYFDVTETVKRRFDEEGISIPYPQRDVHLYEHKEAAVQ